MARSTRSAAVLAASLTAALLAGCATTGSGGGPGAATADTLTMALTSDPNTFDPAKGTAAADYQVAGLLYETLVLREGDEVLPGLAQSWEASPDRAVFTLRDDVTCSDGTPLTPTVAAASLQRFAGPAAAPSAPQVFGPGAATITADDAAGTVTVQLGAPWSDLLYGLVIPQAGIVCSTDEAALQAGKAPGTGPFTLTAAQRGASYTFAARADYKTEPTYSDIPAGRRPATLVANVIQNESTIANQITTGAINYAPLTGPDADRFSGPGFTTMNSPAINFMLVFNERAGRPTADVVVRRAIAQAVDVAAFNNAAARGKGAPMTSVAAATAPCVSTDPAQLVPADPQAAAAVLSGMSLKLVGTNAVAGGAGNAYVQAALQQAGAQVELKNTDNATWASDVLGGQGDWDVTVFPHLNLTNTVTAAATLFTGKAAPGGRNVGGVDNPEFATAMATALATPDGPAKCDAWAQAQRALLQRVDAVPLTSAVVTYVFDARAAAASPGQFVDIATLTIPNS